MVQMIIEPPTLAAMTMRTMRAVCVIPLEEEDKEDGVALALAEEVSVTYTTGAEVGETTCVGVVSIEGADIEPWATDVGWVLVGEVEDEEDEEEDDDDEDEDVVVGRSALTTLPTNPPEAYRHNFSTSPMIDIMKLTEVAEAEDEDEDAEDEDAEVTGILAAGVDADCVGSLNVGGLAPAPLTGSGSWGTGARFLRKRLWLTWWSESNAFASETTIKERTNVMQRRRDILGFGIVTKFSVARVSERKLGLPTEFQRWLKNAASHKNKSRGWY
jgi:hypothetical protein